MYLPQPFQESNVATLHALIRAHPLATWVTQTQGNLVVNHIPFLLDAERGESGTLVGHVARANPVWRALEQESVLVFQGADAYITPSWYEAKREHGKVVPTWNYAVVHAHGIARAIEDKEWLRALVTRLTETHEAEEASAWKVTDAPADYVDKMLAAIVGIEIPVTRLVGKWKVSQNRPQVDRKAVVEGLRARATDAAEEMAVAVGRFVDRSE
jgi:transcriptional regulator